MTISAYTRRQDRETPYRRDSEARNQERMARTMPKDLPGLLRWFEEELSHEMPDALHSGTVWRDRVTQHEAAQGLKPVGASDTGAPGYDPRFQKLVQYAYKKRTEGAVLGPTRVDVKDPENTPSGIAYIENPCEAALGRISRDGKPLMARHLQLLAWASFDWRKRADAIGWAYEEYEVYIREALIRLWREHREWVRSD